MERDHGGDILRGILSGHEPAFSVLYETYWQPLYILAYTKLKDSKEAEDIVSDLFFDLWNKRNALAIHTSLDAYLSVSVKHRIIDAFRVRALRVRREQALALDLTPFDTDTPADRLALDELYHRWQNEVNTLPDQCRLVYLLSEEEELSTKEIAERLNLCERTIENHKYRAMKILKTKLSIGILFVVILS